MHDLVALVRTSALALALMLVAALPAAAAGPVARGSVWGARIPATAPLSPLSRTLSATLNRLVTHELAHRTGPWINTSTYSAPVYTVGADQPTTRVLLDWNVPALGAAFSAVPLPADAESAAGTDAHMVVYQPSRDTMWEFWHMRQQIDPPAGTPTATAGAGGGLPGGPAVYRVSALTDRGETPAAPAAGVTVSAPAGGRVTLRWVGVVGATGYDVYRGPSASAVGLVASVRHVTTAYGDPVTFVDDGSAVAGRMPPSVNTADTPGVWHAGWGGRILRVSRSPGFYRDLTDAAGVQIESAKWGSTASSLPIAPGLIGLKDLAAGRIDHALGLLIPWAKTGAWMYPAQRTDGRDGASDAIPEGARFRLDPRLDLTSLNLPPLTRMIAEAAQRYGLIVVDQTGASVGFRGEDPTPLTRRGRPDPYAPYFTDPATARKLSPLEVLASFPWRRLQVVDAPLYTDGAPPHATLPRMLHKKRRARAQRASGRAARLGHR